VKNLYIIVNKLLSFYDPEQIKKKVEDTYGCPVAAVLPLNEKLVELGSGGLFLRTAPEDGWSKSIRAIADKL
jgi:CO dehydrogenase nickel-insertion accessory protein CooC1